MYHARKMNTKTKQKTNFISQKHAEKIDIYTNSKSKLCTLTIHWGARNGKEDII